MNLISNTGPLIALAKINQLSLLEKMFSKIHIPPAVHRELLVKSGDETARLDEAIHQFIHVTSPPTLAPEVKIATSRLDLGEQQAVALAHQRQELLIIDDRLGRAAAKRLKLSLTGTAGVLIKAKEAGHILNVRPLLEEARQQGYWLSNEFLELATKLAGESE